MRKLIGLLVLALSLLFATAAMAHDEAGQSADKAWGSCCGCAQKCCHKSCGCSSCGHQSSCGCQSKCSSCGHSSCGSCGCKSSCGSCGHSSCGSCDSCHHSCGCCKCCPKLPTEWPDPCRAGDPNSDWDRDGTSRRNA